MTNEIEGAEADQKRRVKFDTRGLLVPAIVAVTTWTFVGINALGWVPGTRSHAVHEAKRSAAASLVDPGSAQFSKVRFRQGAHAPVVCGQLNGKNRFGGYAGYKRFIVWVWDSKAIHEPDSADAPDLDGKMLRLLRGRVSSRIGPHFVDKLRKKMTSPKASRNESLRSLFGYGDNSYWSRDFLRPRSAKKGYIPPSV